MVVYLEDLKNHLRVEYDDEDELLEMYLNQATETAETFCRVSFDESAPEPVHLAILLMASYYYENRDNPDRLAFRTMRTAFDNLLYPFRDPEKMF